MLRSAFATLALFVFLSSARASTITDVVFAIDGSGSIGATSFNSEKNFVKDLLTTGLSATTEVGVFTWSTSTYNLIDPLVPASTPGLTATITNAGYPSQSSYMKNAVQNGINILTAGPSGDKKLLVLLTDGPPNPVAQSPCSLVNTLATNQITVIVVDIANVDGLTAEACLAADSNHSNFFTDAGLASQAIIHFATPPVETPAVPEPGTVALSAGAMFALMMFVRRSAQGSQGTIHQSGRVCPSART
jgi:hypothetical protein